MKKQYRMSVSVMNCSSDAWCAPACQSASTTANCAIMLDTALLAVSFLFVDLLEFTVKAMRDLKEKMVANL